MSDFETPQTRDAPERKRDQPGRTRSRWGAFFAFAALGAMLTFVGFVLWKRGAQPPLVEVTFEQLERAKSRWDQRAVPDYDLEVTVQGPQAAEYAVEVREGQVVSAHRNGQPLTQRRTWETWSVEGMLETITSDLQRQAEPDENQPVQLRIRGHFDPHYGIPRRYLRIDNYPGGHSLEVSWRVTRFEPLGPRLPDKEESA